MNTYRTRQITGINGDSTRTVRLNPSKPMPHIICPEAKPHMERPPLLFAATIGFILGAAAATLTLLLL